MFKEFINWPELDLEYERGESCPFASTQNIKNSPGVLNPSIVKDALVELQQKQQQQEQSQQKQQEQSPTLQSFTPCMPSGQASNSRPATPSATFSTTLASKMTTPFASHSIRTLSRSRRSLNAQKKPGIYCEICSIEFDNYEQHINDEKHIQFLKNYENYQELVNLVETLPNKYPLPSQSSFDSPLNSSNSNSPQNIRNQTALYSTATATTTFTSLSLLTPNNINRSVKITISPRPGTNLFLLSPQPNQITLSPDTPPDFTP